jgi:hypothetical protein
MMHELPKGFRLKTLTSSATNTSVLTDSPPIVSNFSAKKDEQSHSGGNLPLLNIVRYQGNHFYFFYL